MAVKAKDITGRLEKMAPPGLAEDWDNSGWQVGDPDAGVSRVLLALDVTPEVVEEAEKSGAQLIVSHHPVYLKGVQSIRRDHPAGSLVYRLIRAGISVYSAHTNLDNAGGGVSDALARALDLREIQVLHPANYGRLLKLVVFVPVDYAGAVREALGRAGAGWIGNYSHCTFNLRGTGTFRPREGANPFTGAVGELEQVEEIRLETVVRREETRRVLEAMREAHPYEEVAYDLYPLENMVTEQGLGRVGRLAEALPLSQLAGKIKDVLEAAGVRYGGDSDAVVSRVAVCGGSGGDLWPLALRQGAGVLVTGDVRHHAARDMLAAGINFVDAGHFATERLVLPVLRDRLAAALAAAGTPVEVAVSRVEAEPWRAV
ncbi:MAG: Nif3-like dinuclear metal center hexameric protein [Firmicutes bacterium]|nr:Nif3-like dinuclear metal center hexameric protein [Bacillota bacterium]